DYFSDPLGTPDSGSSKKPARTGASYENINSGQVPLEEKVSMGQGRRSYSQKRKNSPATKLVGDWLQHDKVATPYWKKQAADQREAARWSRNVKENGSSINREATRMLTLQLQDEIKGEV